MRVFLTRIWMCSQSETWDCPVDICITG